MLLAEQVVSNPLTSYGPMGVMMAVLIGWLTWIGKWLIGKFTSMISESNAVIERNTTAFNNAKRHCPCQVHSEQAERGSTEGV